MTRGAYRLRGDVAPEWRVLGEEAAVFSHATWRTHVVDTAAVAVLAALAREPRTLAGIEALLAASPRANDAAFAHALVAELVAAGLVEPPAVDAGR